MVLELYMSSSSFHSFYFRIYFRKLYRYCMRKVFFVLFSIFFYRLTINVLFFFVQAYITHIHSFTLFLILGLEFFVHCYSFTCEQSTYSIYIYVCVCLSLFLLYYLCILLLILVCSNLEQSLFLLSYVDVFFLVPFLF